MNFSGFLHLIRRTCTWRSGPLDEPSPTAGARRHERQVTIPDRVADAFARVDRAGEVAQLPQAVR